MTVTANASTVAAPATGDRTTARPRPRLWLRLSIARGDLAQIAGIAAGAGLLGLAANLTAPAAGRLALGLLGWLAIYLCSHSIGHYLAGRALGIRFRFYGIRGTDHPEDYPPGLRQLMGIAPFWSVITDRDSCVRGAVAQGAHVRRRRDLDRPLLDRRRLRRGGRAHPRRHRAARVHDCLERRRHRRHGDHPQGRLRQGPARPAHGALHSLTCAGNEIPPCAPSCRRWQSLDERLRWNMP